MKTARKIQIIDKTLHEMKKYYDRKLMSAGICYFVHIVLHFYREEYPPFEKDMENFAISIGIDTKKGYWWDNLKTKEWYTTRKNFLEAYRKFLINNKEDL